MQVVSWSVVGANAWDPEEITPSYILHTRAFGTYLLGGLFTLQKRLQGDGILHVKGLKILYVMVFYMQTCFIILKSPILHVIFLQNLPTMNILDPIFYRTLFYDFRLVISPSMGHNDKYLNKRFFFEESLKCSHLIVDCKFHSKVWTFFEDI
jgi:hypothetical protein